jgi:hypothetical protein
MQNNSMIGGDMYEWLYEKLAMPDFIYYHFFSASSKNVNLALTQCRICSWA